MKHEFGFAVPIGFSDNEPHSITRVVNNLHEFVIMRADARADLNILDGNHFKEAGSVNDIAFWSNWILRQQFIRGAIDATRTQAAAPTMCSIRTLESIRQREATSNA